MKGIMCLLSFAFLVSAAQFGQETETVRINRTRETVGKTVTIRESTVRTSSREIVTEYESHVMTSDRETGITIRWKYSIPAENTALEAAVSGGKVRFDGVFRGKNRTDEIALDGNPWAQDQNLYMGKFALSGKPRCTFVSLVSREGRLEPYTFEAVRLGDESVAVDGNRVRAIRLRLCIAGFLSMFWNAEYWFDASNGDFLRMESRHGVPEPMIIETVE